jgi:branched-chain amino acid transport system substrate-binding protein
MTSGLNHRVLAALVLLLSVSTAGYSADKIKIGFISTLSGPNSALGIDIRDGFNLALKMNGGKLGGLPAEVILADDKLSPEVGKQQAERLIKLERVDFLTGTVFSNVLLAVAPEAFASKTIYISPNAGPSQLAGEQCNRYFFNSAWQNDTNQGVPGILANNRAIKSVVLIAPNYQAGRDALNGFRSYYKGQVLQEVYTKLGQLDYGVELTQIRAAKPEAVFFFLPGGMGINFIKQFVGGGLSKDISLITAGVSADEDIIRAVGEPMLGIFNTAHWGHDLSNEANRKFVAAYQKEYKQTPSIFASQGYDTALLIDAAVRDVHGSLADRDAVIRALRAKKFQSVRGDFKWGNNNYPIEDWYLRVVGRDAQGRITNKIVGTVQKNLGDPHAPKCSLKW